MVGQLGTSPIDGHEVFCSPDLETWRGRLFELCYCNHGGSGLSFGYEDVQEMSVAEANWMLDALNARRKREAKAHRDAQRGK